MSRSRTIRLSFALLALASTVTLAPTGQLDAQPAPARRGTAQQIAAARTAFLDGLAAVSRNPSAFLQTVRPGTGCQFTLSSSRAERTDSVHEVHAFDAGRLTTSSRMSIIPTGGVIQFAYATVGGAKSATRERRTVKAGTSSATPAEPVADVTVLIAETSQQLDVQLLTKAWSALVQACGEES